LDGFVDLLGLVAAGLGGGSGGSSSTGGGAFSSIARTVKT